MVDSDLQKQGSGIHQRGDSLHVYKTCWSIVEKVYVVRAGYTVRVRHGWCGGYWLYRAGQAWLVRWLYTHYSYYSLCAMQHSSQSPLQH